MYEHLLQVQSETFPTLKLQHRRIHQFFHLLIVDNVWKCHRLMRWLNPLSHKAVLNTVRVLFVLFTRKSTTETQKLAVCWHGADGRSLCNLIMQRSTLPLYLQYCWYLQSFGFGQFSPQCRQHPCECRWPNWGDSPRSPASSWNTMMSKLKVEIFS